MQLGDAVTFSKETTDFSEFEDDFDYLEISGVGLGTNTYATTKTLVSEAPSRAKMKTRVGDIVISTTRPHRGAIAEIKDEHIIASTGFSVIRDVDSTIDRRWLLYVLLSRSSLLQMLQRSSGGNYPAIIEEEMKQIYLPLADRDKQTNMLQELDLARAKRSEKLRRADELLKNFEREVALRYDLRQEPEKSKLCFAVHYDQLDGVLDVKRYKISPDHASTILSDVCEIVEDRVNVASYGSQCIDWIRIDDLPNRPLEIETVRTQQADEVAGTFFEVAKGDILAARLGPTILNQKIVMVREVKRTTIASSEFLVLRCKPGYDPEAVMALLKTQYYRDLMYSQSRGSTPSRYRLNREDMLKLPFPDITMTQKELAGEAKKMLEAVKKMYAEARQDWQTAKERFERELLEE